MLTNSSQIAFLLSNVQKKIRKSYISQVFSMRYSKYYSWGYFCIWSCCFQSYYKFSCWATWKTCSCLILLFLDDWAGNVYAAFIMVTYWLNMYACCCLWHLNNELACRCPREENIMNGLCLRFFGSKLYVLQGCCAIPLFL